MEETVMGVQRVSDADIWEVVREMLDTSRNREDYAWGVLVSFGYAVAAKAAHPGSLVDGPEEWPETDEAVLQWARRSAVVLDQLITATYSS